MGGIVSGSCECGYSKHDMFLGGGFMDHNYSCTFPFFCKSCISFFTANYFDEERVCPECKSSDIIGYDDESLNKSGTGTVFEWNTKAKLGRDLKLTSTNNLCPSCGKFTLRFFGFGCWD